MRLRQPGPSAWLAGQPGMPGFRAQSLAKGLWRTPQQARPHR